MHKLKTNKTFSRPQLTIFIIAFALIGYLIFRSFALNPNLPGDLNNDNSVNIQDLSILLSNYGTSNTTADINGDGTVNILDLSTLLSNYGKSVTAATNISPSTTSHNIDGNLNESDWNIATQATKCVIGTCNNTAAYGILWDNSYLYVGVKVLDSSLKNDSASCWDDDSVEVYIDPTNAGGTTYTTNDRQIVQRYNDSGLCSGVGSNTGVLHAWAAINGGYSVELAIPWSLLGTTASSGKTIGFDVGVNDDDDGGARDSQIVWSGTANNSQDPSGFGKLSLTGAPTGGLPTGGGGTTGGGTGGVTGGLGMYIYGYTSVNSGLNFAQRMTNQQQWLGGQTVTFGEDFPNWDSWDLVPTWETGGAMQNPQWKAVLAMAILPTSLFGGAGSDSQVAAEMQNVANGKYDSYYVTAAQHMAQCGAQCPYIRIAHEFNQGWAASRCAPNPTNFINAFRRVANIVHQYDPGIKIVWNPAHGWNQVPAENCYPGDSYVDVIGLDQYDEVYQVPSPTDPATRWNVFLTELNGLNWLDSFAQQHNKPIALPEWGADIKTDTACSGSTCVSEQVGGTDQDGPYYVQNMHDWLAARASRVAFHIYFNVEAGDGHHQLSATNWTVGDNTSEYPNTAAKFRSLKW